jgi:long-chain fatty acid transport protein
MKRIVLAALTLTPFLTFAGGFQLNLQGIKGVGMGGAFTGLGSDASTVFFNPAGMNNLSGHSFTAGFNYVMPKVSLQTPETANINQTSPNATPFHFYYSGQLNDRMKFGFLVNNQFGSTSSFEEDWQGRYIIQNIALKTFMFQPTMSYKIHDKLFIGGGFVYARGSFTTEKAVPVASATTTEGKAELSGSGDGVGYNIGLFSNIYSLKKETSTTDFRLGISYRSSMPIDLPNGEVKFTNIPVALQNKFPATTTFVSKITLPAVFTAGLSVKHAKENYSLEFAYDFNYTTWSVYDTLAFDFANNDTPDSKTPKDWQNSVTHRFGLDFTYKQKYSVRVGAYYDNTPVKDGYVSPELPDATLLAYTAGLGYKVNDKFSVDLSYIRQSAERESSLESANFTAKYNRIVNVFGIGLNYNFSCKAKESAPSIN